METPEISDLIVDYDPETLARRPVKKRDVVDRFRALKNRSAVRVVERLPDRDGVLDPDAVDALLIRVHYELQRLWEEFRHGPRLLTILRPLVAALRAAGAPRPIRIVDVGCGLGYGTRWLAHSGVLGDDVELIGADYNAALVRRAGELAARENLRCRFVVANAFRLAEPAAIYTSTGVIHHFRGDDLITFFRRQTENGSWAFAHFDLKPSYLAPIGAWIFHQARMREPLAHHDGLLSAVRSHTGEALLAAARAGAPSFRTALFDGKKELIPLLRIFNTVLGMRDECRAAFVDALGPIASRLGSFA